MKRDGLHLVRYKYTGDDLVQRSVRTEYADRAVAQGAMEVHIDYDVTPGPFGETQQMGNWPRNYDSSENLISDPQHNLMGVSFFSYTPAGGPVYRTASGHAKVHSYDQVSYDRLNRATQFSGYGGVDTATYKYDLLGNRSQMRVETYNVSTKTWSYGPATTSNEYTSISVQPPGINEVPQYDPNGNLSRDDGFDAVDDDGFAYDYDEENRLTEAEYDGSQGLTKRASYRYDALGLSWFSLKWRTSLPELHLSGRPSPGIERFSRSRCSRLCREGFNA